VGEFRYKFAKTTIYTSSLSSRYIKGAEFRPLCDLMSIDNNKHNDIDNTLYRDRGYYNQTIEHRAHCTSAQ